jgi:hypothetical protein
MTQKRGDDPQAVMPHNNRTLTTLVTGPSAAAREAAIAAVIRPECRTMLILEGMADGNTNFPASLPASFPASFPAAFPASAGYPGLQSVRIAPSCPCCIGNLTMRVTLNRILRHPPEQLFISLASASHLEQTKHFLTTVPYDAYLNLTKDLQA